MWKAYSCTLAIYELLRSFGSVRQKRSAAVQSHSHHHSLQACFNEQIKYIVRELHAIVVQPQQQHDKSPGGKLEQQMIFARPLDQCPDFDRPILAARDNLRSALVKIDAEPAVVGVGLLSHEIQGTCQRSEEASLLAKERRFEAQNAPASQTLIVPP